MTTRREWAREKVVRVSEDGFSGDAAAVSQEAAITLLRAERARARRVVKDVTNKYDTRTENIIDGVVKSMSRDILRKLK